MQSAPGCVVGCVQLAHHPGNRRACAGVLAGWARPNCPEQPHWRGGSSARVGLAGRPDGSALSCVRGEGACAWQPILWAYGVVIYGPPRAPGAPSTPSDPQRTPRLGPNWARSGVRAGSGSGAPRFVGAIMHPGGRPRPVDQIGLFSQFC